MTVPAWLQDSIFYQIFPDRFANGDPANDPPNVQPWGAEPTNRGFQGGDLEGVIQRFDYLLDLGINAIYFNPIFQASSNHRYNTYDYYRLDPKLGDGDAFRRLLDLAHRHGVRIVLDGVFNHCGRGFFAFNDLLENEQDSPYLNWFHVKGFPLVPYSSTRPANYLSWWNIKSLPKFNTSHPSARAYLLGVARHWIEQGVDGWRLDVPNEIDDDSFWAEFAAAVKGANPQAYICGEIWEVAPRWLGPAHFDGLMNYPLRAAMLDFFVADKTTAAEFGDRIEHLLTVYPREHVFAQLNLLGSHDTERALTLAGGDVRRVRLALSFLFTYPGAPCVYYGDEIGLRGGKDPECRRAFPWDERQWNRSLRDHVKTLIALRQATPALRRGELRRVLADDDRDLYAFARVAEEGAALVALHSGDRRIAPHLPVSVLNWKDGQVLRDALTGEKYAVEGGEIRGIHLGPHSGAVFLPHPPSPLS